MPTPQKRGWRKGQSGNPAGRPPGAGEVARMRAVIAERVPELLTALMKRAIEGDTAAARLLLERSVPALRPAEAAVTVSMAGSMADQARGILAAASAGQLSPGEASQLIGAIAGLAKVIETTELEARLAALEARNAQT